MIPDTLFYPSAAGVTVAGFVLLYFAARLHYSHEARKRELVHTERIKALEVGQPPPDADIARARAAGTIGTLVPLAGLATAAGSTALVFAYNPAAHLNLPLLSTIWGVCGGVIIATVVLSLVTLKHRGGPVQPRERPVDHRPKESLPVGGREGSLSSP